MISHSFKSTAHNLPNLFKGQTLKEFMVELNKQSTLDIFRYDPNKYKGDGFEFFIELFLSLFSCDNRIGLFNYKPNENADNGVDGIAQNMFNDTSVIQVKYRTNTKDQLTVNDDDHLANLLTQAMIDYDVVIDKTNPKNYRHFVFTTAEGLNYYTDNSVLKNKVKCFGFKDISQLVDNNLAFWIQARTIVKSL
jgi:hypothetical protein